VPCRPPSPAPKASQEKQKFPLALFEESPRGKPEDGARSLAVGGDIGSSSGVTRRAARTLVVIGLAAALAYVLYPVGGQVQGVGVLQPSMESLVPVSSPISGLVSRVDVHPPARVTPDLVLLTVAPVAEAGILGDVVFTKPGGVIEPDPGPPPSSRRRVGSA
jgi:hypothetical protein